MIPKNWNPDVQTNLLAGADASSDPETIGPTSAARLRNVSVRKGRPHSRPRFVKRMSLPSGKVQGAFLFVDRSLLMASIDGCVHEIDPQTWARVEKTDATTRGSPNRPRHFYAETPGSLVVQDGQNSPLIYDGSEFRKAEDDEVPVGTCMHYSNGRLAVAVNGGRAVRIGDIRDGGVHQSELKFTETYNLNGGGDFSFPSRVRALGSLPVIDTSTGQGSLIVGCRERTFSLKTQVTARDLWADIGFQTEFIPVGIVGPTAFAGVNQDLYFRSGDGFRSIRSAVSDLASPGLTPLSAEMGYRFDLDTEFLLEFATVVQFDNRVFVTHSPFVHGNRALFLGLAVYNLDALSRGGQKAPPAWDGEWDGLQIAEMVAGPVRGVNRMFIIGRDTDGSNGVWEVLPEKADVDGDEPTQEIITRAFVGAGVNDFKILRQANLWLSEIRSNVSATLYFKSDQYPYWIEWDSWTVAATAPDSLDPKEPLHRPLVTRTPTDEVDPRTQVMYSQGFSFQLRIKWTGKAKIHQVQLWTESVRQPAIANNVNNAPGTQYNEVPAGHESVGHWYDHPVSPVP